MRKTFSATLLVTASMCAFSQPQPPQGGKPLDVRPFFSEVDTNKDGCASREEWMAAGAPISSYEGLKDEKGCVRLERMMKEPAPDGIDTNHDGKLTLAELKAFDSKMPKQRPPSPMPTMTLAEKAGEALQIQNVMSRRMFYHSVGRNELELELWSKARANEIRWAQNQGCWVGMKSLKVYYDDVNRKMQAAQLKAMAAKNPAIKDTPENRYIGNMVLHTLTTPIIEVADDGQSAKGVWYTPGAILTTKADGVTPEGIWMWERYGIDLIKENGRWVILHAQVNTDFGNPMGLPLQKQGADAAAMGAEGGGPGPGAAGLQVPGPDQPARVYDEFSPTRVPRLEPRLPEPYRTAKETFEYADCSSDARGK